MNAALLTFYHIHHYGAALQALATVRAAEDLGASCEIPDYYVNQSNALFRPLRSPASAAANAHTALHYRALKTRQNRFDAFCRTYLPITPRRYENIEELRREAGKYDLFLAGSDQIWNPWIFPDQSYDPVFFGGFTEARKIAYGPSFGPPNIPQGMEQDLKKWLDQFTHLSAREPSGQNLIASLTGRTDVPVVLDPTLLRDAAAWEALAAPPDRTFPKGYLLLYCISDPAPLEPCLRRVRAMTGLPVVQLCGLRKNLCPGAVRVLDAGPAEFLGWFRGASFVLTNSFHGTVFSVLFEKPFFAAVSPAERRDPENARIAGLLGRLGLENRIIGPGTAEIDASIHWDAASGALERERQASLAYLEAAIRNIPYEAPQKTPPAVPVLASRETCTGCTACKSVCPKGAIAMERDREGFAFPVVHHDLCVRCGKCTAVCPALHPREKRDARPAAFAAWNRDPALRRESTSGGVFSALANHVLDSGGAVFGAALDGKQRAVHTAVLRKEELWRLRGAKYVQTDLRDTFPLVRQALRRGPVLFSGTPCQVDGLYHYLGKRPENLITCDLVCHGVPSPGVWEAVTEELRRNRGAELKSVRFRDKSGGGAHGRLTVVYENGAVDSQSLYETPYGRAFGRNLFLRRCCYRCPYANLNRPGDFTLGDLWGLEPGELPDQRQLGVSLLLVNTPHLSRVFDHLPLERRPWNLDRAVSANPNLCGPTARPMERDAFFSAFALDPFPAVYRRFFTVPPLPLRAASKLLTPEVKEKIKKLLK